MPKLYKTRKECLICKQIFYPKYSGTLYCETCKKPIPIPKPKTPIRLGRVPKPKTVLRAKHLK